MKERLPDFIGELKTVTSEELGMIHEKVWDAWLKKWTKYLIEGGDRPKHPPRVP